MAEEAKLEKEYLEKNYKIDPQDGLPKVLFLNKTQSEKSESSIDSE